MKAYKFLLLIIFISSPLLYSKELTNPFAPVNRSNLASHHMFSEQSISDLKLSEIIHIDSSPSAVITDKGRNRYTVNVGDRIGMQAGKVILINKDRVVVMVKSVVSGKTIFKIDVLKINKAPGY